MALEIGLILTAIGGGLVNFFSPCNLVLLPTYISFLASTAKSRAQSFILSVMYSIGFAFTYSVIIILLSIGLISVDVSLYMTLVVGILIILFGIFLFFNKEITRYWKYLSRILSKPLKHPSIVQNDDQSVNQTQNSGMEEGGTHDSTETDEKIAQPSSNPYKGMGRALILGLTMGSSLSVCSTPILLTITSIAAESADYTTALYLMMIFALAVMIPFIIIGLTIGEINNRWLAKMIKIGEKMDKIFAVILVWIGIEYILTYFGLPGLVAFI